jgi:hypothetical protein
LDFSFDLTRLEVQPSHAVRQVNILGKGNVNWIWMEEKEEKILSLEAHGLGLHRTGESTVTL